MGLGKKMCKYKRVSSIHITGQGNLTQIYCRNPVNPISKEIGLVNSDECCRKNCKYYESR